MKTVGIVAEYNPFHNGHKYHIEETRRQTNADYVVVIMSGDFTQRGTPAIVDKYTRTEMALKNGADLVIELPTIFSCASAEYFSSGAISILNGLGIIDLLSFGSESGDIKHLTELATFLLNESDDFSEKLMSFQKKGYTYPLARSLALESTLPGFSTYSDILNHPNNILGMEYCKSIQKIQSTIKPFSIIRKGNSYHQYQLANNFSSARAIRQSIKSTNNLTHIKSQVPETVYSILKKDFNTKFPIFKNDISLLLKYKLLLGEDLGYANYFDLSNDFSDRIQNHLHEYTDFDEFCTLLNSKQITYSRISRGLLHILLNITKQDIKIAENPENLYARMLGFKESACPLLKEIKDKGTIPFISKLADAENSLTTQGYQLLKKDVFASHLYESLKADKLGTSMTNEFTRNIIHF
jgi:predicted nucleotidyltransferase